MLSVGGKWIWFEKGRLKDSCDPRIKLTNETNSLGKLWIRTMKITENIIPCMFPYFKNSYKLTDFCEDVNIYYFLQHKRCTQKNYK